MNIKQFMIIRSLINDLVYFFQNDLFMFDSDACTNRSYEFQSPPNKPFQIVNKLPQRDPN